MNLNIDTGAILKLAAAAGKAGLPALESAIQIGATAVVAPYGLSFVPALVLPTLFKLINTQLGLDPDTPPDQTAAKIEDDPQAAQTALATLNSQQQFALDQQKQADDARLAGQAQQTALDALDTSAQDRVQRWWRPAIGWGLGGLVLGSFALPYPVWMLECFGLHLPPVPQLDGQAIIMLGGLLGITVAARSADKAVKASTVKAVTTAAVRR